MVAVLISAASSANSFSYRDSLVVLLTCVHHRGLSEVVTVDQRLLLAFKDTNHNVWQNYGMVGNLIQICLDLSAAPFTSIARCGDVQLDFTHYSSYF